MGSFFSQLFGDQRDSPERETDQQRREESQEQVATQDNGNTSQREGVHQGRKHQEQREVTQENFRTLCIEDERLSNVLIVKVGPPLTTQQLAQDALKRSDDSYWLFVVEFPEHQNSVAYIDTHDNSLRYKEMLATTDLSILMIIKNTGSIARPSYQWASVALPKYNLKVTEQGIGAGTRAVHFTPENQLGQDTPWRVQEDTSSQLLSFSTIMEGLRTKTTTWYLEPEPNDREKRVAATHTATFSITVRKTDYTDKRIPGMLLLPSDGGNDL